MSKNEKKKSTGELTIRSVRNKRTCIAMEWTVNEDDHKVTFHDNPLPSFYKALEALPEHVCTLCELPAKDAGKIQAVGITLRPNGENQQALIVARKKIAKGKRVFNIATPLLSMYADDENPGGDHMDPEIAKAIAKVESEAKKYILGERAQGRIEFEEEKPAKDTKGETPDFPAMSDGKDD